MKWTDLESGDILKFDEEFIKEIENIDNSELPNYNLYPDEYKFIIENEHKLFIINSISVGHSGIVIRLDIFKPRKWDWILSFDGYSLNIPNNLCYKPFKIVSLNKDI